MRVYLQRSGPWRPLFLDAGSEAALSSLGEVVSEPDPRAPGIAERLRGCTAVLSLNGHGAEDVTAGVLREAGTVELVCVAHSWGHFGGLERETGVRVVEVSNAGTRAVAEWVLAATLEATRRLTRFDRALKHGSAWGEPRHAAGLLAETTVGVVGLGRTGRYVARAFRALGVHVLAATRSDGSARAAALDVELVGLDELLRRADVVTLHQSPVEGTAGLLGPAELALLRDGAVLVNSAHASLVDEAALLAELRSGRLAACLDVFDPEPLDRAHPLRRLGNVLLTPHIAASNAPMFRRCGRDAVEALRTFAAGGDVVDRRYAFP